MGTRGASRNTCDQGIPLWSKAGAKREEIATQLKGLAGDSCLITPRLGYYFCNPFLRYQETGKPIYFGHTQIGKLKVFPLKVPVADAFFVEKAPKTYSSFSPCGRRLRAFLHLPMKNAQQNSHPTHPFL